MSAPFVFVALVSLASTLALELSPEAQSCIKDCYANNKWMKPSEVAEWAGETTIEILDQFCPMYSTMMGCQGPCVDMSGSALSDFMKSSLTEDANELIDLCSSYNAGLSVVPAYGIVIAVTVPAAMIVIGRMLLV